MDDFQFDERLKSFFGAKEGAGSRVTGPDEAKKKQITVTQKFERPIFESFFKSIPKGTKDEFGEKCMAEFRLFPTGEVIRLPLLYRPNDKDGKKRNELRFYMNKGVFFPPEGMFWFCFLKNNEMWLGSLYEEELSAVRDGRSVDLENGTTSLDELEFQATLNGKAPVTKTSTSTTFVRDPNVARTAIIDSGFKCEMFPLLPQFTSRVTGNPFVEAHHLVPMFAQRHFPDINLDVVENICVLNPYSHRMIHHGKFSDIEGHIQKMADSRTSFLAKIGLSTDRVFAFYKGDV